MGNEVKIMKKKIFITGSSGFIGFHLSRSLLEKGISVHGFDSMNNYYDVKLKKSRLKILKKFKKFTFKKNNLENMKILKKSIFKFKPNYIIHLGAQAGVRYSIDAPMKYISSNIIGTFNIIELAHKLKIKHLLIASSSSVYGSNKSKKFKENDKADNQLSIYAATKKSTESIAHSYSSLWNLPITALRFFTVYGPWGRPDMAYFKFVSSILNNKPIDIYNNGDMYRDFTYVDDLVNGIKLLIGCIPTNNKISENDSLSSVAPFRLVNIGNSDKIKLIDFIEAIEESLNKKAIRNYMPMQKGDVAETWADTSLLKDLTGYISKTNFDDGITHFVKWYQEFYGV